MSSVDLRGRDLLKEIDFTADELTALLDVASVLKRAGRQRDRHLDRQCIALIFEKTSTRTRVSFEVAMRNQGGHVTVLDPASSQVAHKESIPDTARVLARIFDGIEFRGAAQATVETLAQYADVPVYNGLTDEWHPTQMLADFLTMREHAGTTGDLLVALQLTHSGRFSTPTPAGRRPRIAVAALNPHGGEGGLFGDEEPRIVVPAVAELRGAGIDVTGPRPADQFAASDHRPLPVGRNRFTPVTPIVSDPVFPSSSVTTTAMSVTGRSGSA